MVHKILIYSGPWSFNQLAAIAFGYDKAATITYAFDWPDIDKSGLSIEFRKALKTRNSSDRPITEEEVSIILRCRYLRSLSSKTALTRLRAMRKAWQAILSDASPDLVICSLIDSYVPHLLEILCKEKNIQFHGLVGCFINGYFRSTRYGELVSYREPAEDEVKSILSKLTQHDYKPSFVSSLSRRKVIRNWSRSIGRMIYMGIRSMRHENRLKNHVYGSWKTAIKNFHFFPSLNLGVDDWEQILDSDSERLSIFVPLQHVPEATIDYWAENIDLIDYNKELIEILRFLAGRFRIVVKEHPNVQGFRNPNLYDDLHNIPGLIFAPTATHASQISAKTNATLVWTGSVGFEAALNGKPVLSPVRPYYAYGERFINFDFDITLDQIQSLIIEINNRTINEEEQLNLLRNLLSGCSPGSVQFKNNWSGDLNAYHNIGAELRLIDSRLEQWAS